jgi:NADPH:quinone reductase-like Zn-dependent oxidoreductase
MTQLMHTATGGDPAQTIQLQDLEMPQPGTGQVLVAIEAAPINNADFLLAAGWYGVQPPLPAPAGSEGVGRVLAVGPQVDPALTGRRVLVLPTYEHGTWADRVIVAARNVVPVGDGADPLQLAMLPVNPATAHLLLNHYVKLQPGDWIGLNMANSAVGQAVIALAKRAGLRVLAIVRREDAAERVKAADLVLVDADNIAERIVAGLGGDRLRLALDGVGGAKAGDLVQALAFGGTMVSFSAATGQPPVIPLGDLIYREITLHGLFIINWIRTAPREELEQTYAALADLVEQGVLRADIEATYPLERYQEALAHARRTGRSGKVLFVPQSAGE